jgi:hypothetical protein
MTNSKGQWWAVSGAFLLLCSGASFSLAETGAEVVEVPAASPPAAEAADLPIRQPERVRESAATAKLVERQREGTKLIEQVGTFEFLGDRAAFLPSGAKESYRVLENLALERVSRQTIDTRGQQEWTISGTLTEFKGANYLLITKAVARVAPAQ